MQRVMAATLCVCVCMAEYIDSYVRVTESMQSNILKECRCGLKFLTFDPSHSFLGRKHSSSSLSKLVVSFPDLTQEERV